MAVNDSEFMVSSGFYHAINYAIKSLYEKAAAECDARGFKRYEISGVFQVLSEMNQGTMGYCIIAVFIFS